jgi:septal ring factor EnvC (AmiA/AmiB activator)
MEKIINATRLLIKDFAKMPQPTQLLVACVLVVAAFSFGQCNSDSKLNQFREQFAKLQKEANVTKQFADSTNQTVIRLTTESKQKDKQIESLTVTIEVTNKQRSILKGSLSKLEDSLHVVKDTAQIVAIQEGIIYNLKEQVTNAEAVIGQQKEIISAQQFKITKLDSAVALATQRGDSLQTIVNKVITMPKPPRQWISKKTAGMIAFATGVIVGDQLARR